MFQATQRVGRACLCAGVLATFACTGKYQSDFSVIVTNRTTNTLQLLANGNSIGEVATGQSGTFSLHLTESNTNVFTNGVAPTPQAAVVLSAKDMKTNAISTPKSLTLSQSNPTYVTFSPSDFPSVAPTVARFTTSPTTPGLNQDVFFNASSSTASNATYLWDFGDGRSGSGVTTTHAYGQTGTFTVTLTVTSDNGQTSTSSRTVTVSATLPPTAATFAFSPTNPAINQDVTFVVSIVTNGVRYTWEFGDGTTGSGATVSHRFTRAGTYTVTLRATNDIGQSATSSRPVTASATSPQVVARFTFSPTTPGILDTVSFNASSSSVDSGGNYAWDFGDGARGTGVIVTHQYGRVGTYTITLTLTNDFGQTSTTSRTVPVGATSTAIVASFTFSPTDPTISLGTNSVIFDARDSSPGLSAWIWDFGDGTDDGTGQRISHTFARAGTWVVRLTVSDAQGRIATTTKQVTVKATP